MTALETTIAPIAQTDDEIIEGYFDGLGDDRIELPTSLENRTASYRHGWLNGRDDRIGRSRGKAKVIRNELNVAVTADIIQ